MNTLLAPYCEIIAPLLVGASMTSTFRQVKRAMERIAAGQLADPVTLKTDFENTGVLEEYGGTKYLVQLISANVGWMATGDYARAIYDTWLRRKLLDVCHDASEAAYGAEPGEPVEDMINRAAEAVMALGEHGIASSTDLGVAVNGAIRRSEAAYKGTPGFARLDTGIAPVDALWGGLCPGQLYYLMARSRTGKTPFMMQLVRNVAARLKAEGQGEHVHVFSLEMTSEDLATINLASTTRWTSDQIRAGQIDDWHDFMSAGRELGRLPVVIDDRAEMDITALFLRGGAIRGGRKPGWSVWTIAS